MSIKHVKRLGRLLEDYYAASSSEAKEEALASLLADVTRIVQERFSEGLAQNISMMILEEAIEQSIRENWPTNKTALAIVNFSERRMDLLTREAVSYSSAVHGAKQALLSALRELSLDEQEQLRLAYGASSPPDSESLKGLPRLRRTFNTKARVGLQKISEKKAEELLPSPTQRQEK